MVLSDILLVTALFAFLIVWRLRAVPGRSTLLPVFSVAALAFGVWSVSDGDISYPDPDLMVEFAEISAGDPERMEKLKQNSADESFGARRQAMNDYQRYALASDSRLISDSPSIWGADRVFVLGELSAGSAPHSIADDRYLNEEKSDFLAPRYGEFAAIVLPYDLAQLRKGWVGEYPGNETVRVILETSFGDVEIELYPKQAPIAAANFLAHVDGGHFDGASFYRASRKADGAAIDVLQGGLSGAFFALPPAQQLERIESLLDGPFAPIAHETTDKTGILNERGTVAWGRLRPGTARAEFFINITDNPSLDTGDTSRNPDGQGYATFGRVLRGMRVLEAIQAMPANAPTGIEVLEGQILTEKVIIERVYRIE